MIDRKITDARFHVGIQVGPQVLTSLNAERDDAVMAVSLIGVYVKSTRKMVNRELIIPWGHVSSVELAPLVKEAVKK